VLTDADRSHSPSKVTRNFEETVFYPLLPTAADGSATVGSPYEDRDALRRLLTDLE